MPQLISRTSSPSAEAELFELSVTIVTDGPGGLGAKPCDTSDGCDPTCDSSCASAA